MLKGKTAIITGAGKGIGLAVARALAQEGVRPGLMARSAPDLERAQKELKEPYSVDAAIAVADVGNRGEAEAAVARLIGKLAVSIS